MDEIISVSDKSEELVLAIKKMRLQIINEETVSKNEKVGIKTIYFFNIYIIFHTALAPYEAPQRPSVNESTLVLAPASTA